MNTKGFFSSGSRLWNMPYLLVEYKFPRKTSWEFSVGVKPWEFSQITRSINGTLLPCYYPVILWLEWMRPNRNRAGSRCGLVEQCSAKGLLDLWRDSVCTKKCQRQILFLLYHSDQGGPAQKENCLVTKKRNGILLTIACSSTTSPGDNKQDSCGECAHEYSALVIRIVRAQTEQCLLLCVLSTLRP